jgi:hypothetical protein
MFPILRFRSPRSAATANELTKRHSSLSPPSRRRRFGLIIHRVFVATAGVALCVAPPFPGAQGAGGVLLFAVVEPALLGPIRRLQQRLVTPAWERIRPVLYGCSASRIRLQPLHRRRATRRLATATLSPLLLSDTLDGDGEATDDTLGGDGSPCRFDATAGTVVIFPAVARFRGC